MLYVREKLDERNTLTVKQQPIESVKPKTKVSIGLYLILILSCVPIIIYIENDGSLSSRRLYWVQRFVCCSCWE